MTEAGNANNVTLHDLEATFKLQLDEGPGFFPDWQTNLPDVDPQEMRLLDKLKAGYLNLVKYPPMLENTVQMTVLAPLLYLADFYLAPFNVKSEASVSFADVDEGVTVEGRIDVLILKGNLWVVVVESKRASFSVEAGLAQLLSYMLSNPHPGRLNVGLITTGGSFAFVKLVPGTSPRYALSRVFELRNPGNELYSVLRVLKHFRQLFLQSPGS